MRSMLYLVQDQMASRDEASAPAAIEPDDAPVHELIAGLDPESPEAVFLRYIQSLGRDELTEMRREICLAALASIDAELAAMEAA